MLSESHPLSSAQAMLMILFERAPEDQMIEFRCIWNANHKNKPPADAPFEGRHTIVLPCQVKSLEKSFDVALADQLTKISAVGYDIYYGVCPRVKMSRYNNANAKAGNANLVSHAVAAWMDYDQKNWPFLLQDKRFPKPSIVVSTGHGAHFYWRYAEAVEIDRATDDSKNIANLFGGDKCYDAPRILRVPGTKNWKEPELNLMAQVEEINVEEVFHGLAPEVQPPPVEGQERPKDIKDLPWDLQNVIRNGYDAAGDPYVKFKEDGKIDRSSVDIRVAIALFEYKFSRERIGEIFSDPQYGISGKVLEEAKSGNAQNYLSRTLDKAEIEVQRSSLQHGELGDVAQFETCDDLDKAPQLKFAVDRLLPVGGLFLMSGPAKAGKSLMALDIALLLAGAEGAFLDCFPIAQRGTVAYFQAEVSKSSLKNRIMQIAASRDANWRKYPIFFLHTDFDLANPRHVTSIVNGLKKVKADYMIIDPLACFHHNNENNHGEMSHVMANIRRIAKDSGVMGTIVVHHHGKPVEGAPREGIQMLRGATVIGDRANSSLTLTSQYDEVLERKYVTANFALRDADTPNPMKLLINKDSLRFEAYVDEEAKFKIVREVVADSRDKDDAIKQLMRRLKTTKAEAERLVSRDRFSTTQAASAVKVESKHPHVVEIGEEDLEDGAAVRDEDNLP